MKETYYVEKLKTRFRFINGEISKLKLPNNKVKIFVGSLEIDTVDKSRVNEGLYRALHAKRYALDTHMLHLENFIDEEVAESIKQQYQDKLENFKNKKSENNE